jgi:DNA-directed RNA polymerase subunit RPC12/RpoP
MPSPAGVAAPPEPKICVVCGKDVSGHRRLKDSRGYVCYSCAKEEQRQERGGRVRCRGCGRLVKEETLNDYEGAQICHRCYAERQKLQKQEIKRLGLANVHTEHERRRLYSLLLVAGVLLLIIILNKFGILPKFF